jgi:hypothetical protein
MKWLMLWMAYEFIRSKMIWLWCYLIKKGQGE